MYVQYRWSGPRCAVPNPKNSHCRGSGDTTLDPVRSDAPRIMQRTQRNTVSPALGGRIYSTVLLNHFLLPFFPDRIVTWWTSVTAQRGRLRILHVAWSGHSRAGETSQLERGFLDGVSFLGLCVCVCVFIRAVSDSATGAERMYFTVQYCAIHSCACGFAVGSSQGRERFSNIEISACS